MSFILDALKKSESDRQRQSGPSLFEVKVAPPRRTLPIWAVAIAVLLGINIIVVSWMLLRHPAEEPPTAAHPSHPSHPTHPAAAAPTREVAANAGNSVAPPASASPSAAAAAPSTAVKSGAPPAPTAGATPVDQSASAQPDVITPSDYAPAVEPAGSSGPASGSATDDLPLYQQIVASAGLPALHLDLHVYAQRPRDRFAMINMHRVQEGETLPSGVQVEAIRPDGVVLSYRGTRFLLPRN
jgi:general secretion pathway protein B